MTKGLTTSSDYFLNALSRHQERLGRLQRQISSGLRIERPSDAPDEVSNVLRLRADIARSEQIRSNLERVKAEAEAADDVLQRTVKLLEESLTMALQGASELRASTRPALAPRAQGIHEELVRLSRTTLEGRFLFSGDADQQPPYKMNSQAENGVDQLTTAGATRLVEHPAGGTFAAGLTAQQIFDTRNPDETPAEDNIFTAVHQLRQALENNDTEAIEASLGKIRAAHEHAGRQLSFYGHLQNKISSAVDLAHANELQWKSSLSRMEETDIAAAIVELTEVQRNQEAALLTQSRPRQSLFDYLK